MAAPNITQVTVGSTTYSAIRANSQTRRITFAEDPGVAGWPTTDWYLATASDSVTPRRIIGGVAYEFTKNGGNGYFGAGEIVGWAKAASGSTTFYQSEEPML